MKISSLFRWNNRRRGSLLHNHQLPAFFTKLLVGVGFLIVVTLSYFLATARVK